VYGQKLCTKLPYSHAVTCAEVIQETGPNEVYWINLAAGDKWRVIVNLGKETSGTLQGGEFLQSSISEFNCF